MVREKQSYEDVHYYTRKHVTLGKTEGCQNRLAVSEMKSLRPVPLDKKKKLGKSYQIYPLSTHCPSLSTQWN